MEPKYNEYESFAIYIIPARRISEKVIYNI
jgi:hypothetical protein